MAIYYYKGQQIDKKKKSGLMAADSERELDKILKMQAIKRETSRYLFDLGGIEYKLFPKKRITKLNRKQMTDFFEQLYFTLESGLSLAESMSILTKSSNIIIARVGLQLDEYIARGVSLVDALERTKLFPNDIIVRLKVGVESAQVSRTLKTIVRKLKDEAELKSKITSAIAYPIGLLVVMFALAGGLLTFVIPTIAEVLTELGGELPGLTLWVMGLSDFLIAYWWVILLSVSSIIGGHISLYKKPPKYKYFIDKSLYKIPTIGELILLNQIYAFNTTFHQMIDSGVEQDRALKIIIDLIGNSVMKETLVEIHRDVANNGFNLYNAMEKQEILPADYTQFVMIGINTGELAEILESVSVKYKMDIEARLDKLTKMMEPIAIVLIGIVIGTFVVSMWLPLFGMTDNF